MVILSFYNFSRIDFDWDLPAYLGCAIKKNSNIIPEDLHEKVYYELKAKLPEKSYRKIIGKNPGNKYRNFISKNPDAYYQQLRYYDIKELYIDAIYLVNLLVNDIITSIYLLNSFYFILFGFLISTILSVYCRMNSYYSYLLTIIICILPFISNLARIASPDLMTLVLMAVLCYFFISKARIYYQILATIIIVCTRPDYILFTVLYLLLVFFIEERKRYIPLLIGLMCNALFYIIIIHSYNYPGWSDLFYDTFIHRRLIISEPVFVGYKEYFHVIFKSFANFKKITLASLIFLLLALFLYKKKWLEKNNFLMILLMFFSLYLKFMFFPAAGETRFFIVYLLMMGIFVLNPKKFNKAS